MSKTHFQHILLFHTNRIAIVSLVKINHTIQYYITIYLIIIYLCIRSGLRSIIDKFVS